MQQLAYLLRYATREQDIVARLSGEEFAIAIADIDRNQAELLSYRLCEQVAQEIFEVNGERVPLTVSIGIIYSQSSRRELNELIEAADGALYEAKGHGVTHPVSRTTAATPALVHGEHHKGHGK